MKRLLKVICISCLPSVAFSQPSSISCQITADKSVYKVGEVPIIIAHILNNTDSTIQLVKALDGSDAKWRYPYVYYEVTEVLTSKSKPVAPTLMLRCGNMDGIDTTEFVTVKAKQLFNPLANQSAVYTDGISLTNWRLKRGTYKITFHYSTNELDFRKWMGDMAMYWFDWETKKILPANQQAYQMLLARFSKVPKADISSNELTIEFR